MNGHQKLVLQSKEWLLKALFELMQDKSFQDISVTEIAEAAGLSRRTFYRTFKDKQELLEVYADELIHEYIEALDQVSGQMMKFDDIVQLFFEFWAQHRNYARVLIQQDLFYIIFHKWNNHASQIYQKFHAPWHITGTPTEINYVLAYSIGGLWQILEIWLMSETPEKPEQITKTMMKALDKLGTVGRFD
ncbi:MAG: TetR/AcrR family transcriptional regulator [Leuconostoc carnosum]|uniref:TetR/AcrR family transcriptional regulator n=1 Tax=Leuconostoc carnosum TaxID=1252 RepID=UPI003F9C13BD